MGKVDRLRNKVEPFAALIWALGSVYLPTTDPARRPSITPQQYTKLVLIYDHAACTVVESWFNFSTKTRCPLPPIFLSKYVIFL